MNPYMPADKQDADLTPDDAEYHKKFPQDNDDEPDQVDETIEDKAIADAYIDEQIRKGNSMDDKINPGELDQLTGL